MKTLLTILFLLFPTMAVAAPCGDVPEWSTLDQAQWDSACDDLAAHGYDGETLVGLAETYAFGKCWDALTDPEDAGHEIATAGFSTDYPDLYVVQDTSGRVYVSAQDEATKAVIDEWRKIDHKPFKNKKWKEAAKLEHPMPPATAMVNACGVSIEIAVDVSESTTYIKEDPLVGFKPRLKLAVWYDFHNVGNILGGWNPEDGLDIGLAFEPLFFWKFNLNIAVGIRSFGGGLGIDITKNFGAYVGAQVRWGTWKVAPGAGLAFAF